MSSHQGNSTSFPIILHILLYLTWFIWNCWRLTWEARATALSCQWLMGTCSVNSITLPNGKSWSSGVSICSNFVWFFFFAKTLVEINHVWFSWWQSPGVHWEMQVSGREQMPWYLHQHVQTANSGLLMCCIWNSRFLSSRYSFTAIATCAQVELYIKSTGTMICNLKMLFVWLLSVSRNYLQNAFFPRKNVPDWSALFIFRLYALWIKVIYDPFSEVLLFF